VTGGVLQARAGAIALLYGSRLGAPGQHLRRLLESVATHITVCAGPREAAIAKLVNNVAAVLTAAVTLEAVNFGLQAGLSREAVFDVLQRGTADSHILRNSLRRALLEGDSYTGFATRLALKDLELALTVAEEAGTRLPYTEAAASQLTDSMIEGDDDLSFAAALAHRTIDPSGTPRDGERRAKGAT
jgi:3-hydroxyisobutyrate dehydrogenase-like beta-hydroxyacid dehydrogenase